MNIQTLLTALHNTVAITASERFIRARYVYRNRLGIDEVFLKLTLSVHQSLYRYAYLLSDADYCERAANRLASRSTLTQTEPTTNIGVYYEEHLRNKGELYEGGINAYAASPFSLPARTQQTAFIPGDIEICIINHRSTELFEENTTVLAACANTARATNAEEIRLTSTPNTHVRMFKTTPDNATKTVYHILTVGLNTDVIKRLRHVLYADAVRAIENKAQTVGPEGIFETNLVNVVSTLNNEENITLTHEWLNMRNHEELTRILFTDFVTTIEQRLAEQQRRRVTEAINNIPDTRLTTLERRLRERQEAVRVHENNLAHAMREYEETHNAYYAAKYSEEEANAAVKTFLLSLGDKLLDVWASDYGTYLNVFANNTCTFFNSAHMLPYLQNPRSELSQQPNWVYNLMVEVFYKKTYKLKMTVGFKINLNSGEVGVILESTNSNLLRYDAHTGLPNPHHEFYNCWGDNKTPIREAIQGSNITEALMIAYAATAGIKLTDSAVFSKMLQYLRMAGTAVLNRPCLIDPEGNTITLQEYKTNNNAERIRYQ